MLLPIVLFVHAALAEIGGGYLVWLWLREGRAWWVGLIGALVLYGVLPTLQPQSSDFARTYAAYGGLFIVGSLLLLWSRLVEGRVPDSPSLWGASLALVGALVITYWPRA